MKTGYTEESPGVKSSTRLGFLEGLNAVLLMAGYMTYSHEDPVKIGIFLGAGITACGGAKFFGTRNEKPKEEEKPQ
jgi:hypothetical protein